MCQSQQLYKCQPVSSVKMNISLSFEIIINANKKVLLVIKAVLKMYAWIYSKKWICLHWMPHLKRVSLFTKCLLWVAILSEKQPEILSSAFSFWTSSVRVWQRNVHYRTETLAADIAFVEIINEYWLEELGIQEIRFILLPVSCLSSFPELWTSSHQILKSSIPTPSWQWQTVTPSLWQWWEQ